MLSNRSKAFHLNISRDDVGKYVILPGDPGRVPIIAAYLDNPVPVAQNREYSTYTGTLEGTKVSVTSTGIGGPSAAIAIEELIMCGAHTFIRVGTCGGMDTKVIGGDLVIASAAIRGDGTSKEYLPLDYPAVADFEVVTALKTAAAKLVNEDGKSVHVGVVQSKDSFYGELSPDTMPVKEFLNERWEAYIRAGCLASEMEAATLMSVGIARGVRVGAILTAIWNLERPKHGLPNPEYFDNHPAIKAAIDAVRELLY